VDAEDLIDQLRARVTELRGLIAQGGAEARSAVEAILGQARFIARPVIVDGRKRWDLRVRLGGGYLYQAAGASLPRLCAPQKSLIKGTVSVPTAPEEPAINTPAGASPASEPATTPAPAVASQPQPQVQTVNGASAPVAAAPATANGASGL
jgi:hypothetical protein